MTQSSAGSVLIVEDEEVIREVLTFQAHALGLETYAAANGKEALQILREKKPDAVLSDLRMPQMSGMMLLHTMREEGIHAPFIFVTAFASTDTTIQALRLGAFDFIEKPFHANDIEQVLLEAVRVGREQNRLAPTLTKAAPASGEDAGTLQAAEMQIMKIRTLRLGNDEQRIPDQNDLEVAAVAAEGDERKRLIELFAFEAQPQLVFCEASLRGLADEKQRPFELGYLFRVMQAIRMSASAIHLDAINELAAATEAVCTYFRVNPRAIRPSGVEVLREAIEALKQRIEALTQGDTGAADTALMKKLRQLHENA